MAAWFAGVNRARGSNNFGTRQNPIGCLPTYLSKFETSDKNQYDPSTGCLKWLNEFAQYHNEQLQIELSRI
ncbi:GDSL esterase/lipase [Prunus dulcis]|uniref:GDSL esterase/lipase n=1 Tax=Prunus dulcis TaxID=3755 RepID=A0A4Y1R9X1_PRUDU|nr:GDSL esterase/lipase [Prunus dulcis]